MIELKLIATTFEELQAQIAAAAKATGTPIQAETYEELLPQAAEVLVAAESKEDAPEAAPAPEPAPAPDEKPLKKEDVRAVLAGARDKGVDIGTILMRYGKSLGDVDVKDYPALIQEAKAAMDAAAEAKR